MYFVFCVVISLRYLQFESRALPALSPLPNTTIASVADSLTLGVDDNNPTGRGGAVLRSGSLDTISSATINDDGSNSSSTGDNGKNGNAKLPSLLVTPKITASMDNCMPIYLTLITLIHFFLFFLFLYNIFRILDFCGGPRRPRLSYHLMYSIFFLRSSDDIIHYYNIYRKCIFGATFFFLISMFVYGVFVAFWSRMDRNLRDKQTTV